MTKINTAGRAIIEAFEVPKDGNPDTPGLDPYMDPEGYWTIGYGHLITDPVSGRPLKGDADRAAALAQYPNGLSSEEADNLLESDLPRFESPVTAALDGVEVTENQFSAMVSLAFNIGVTAFASSTLLRLVRAGDFDGASKQFARWNKGVINGQVVVLPGLTRRREAERMLFVRQDYVVPKPLVQSKTIVGAAAGGTATIAGVATQVSQLANDPDVKIAAISSPWHWMPVVLGIVGAVAFGIIIFIRYRDRKAGVH